MSKVDEPREGMTRQKFLGHWGSRMYQGVETQAFLDDLDAIIEAARQEGRNEFIGDICTCDVMPCHFHPGQEKLRQEGREEERAALRGLQGSEHVYAGRDDDNASHYEPCPDCAGGAKP